jgi:hypothetical protein
MGIFSFGDATPTKPMGQFSGRCGKGYGVAHRAPFNTGQPALFANTPLEVMNRREFCCYWQEFIDNMDCSHVQGAAGEPGALWELIMTTTATATFDLLTDVQNGVAELNVVETTADMGVQIQLWPSAITAAGECIRPATQQVVTWAMSGKMTYPLTTDWFVGLAEDGGAASILTVGTGAIANDHYIGFHHLEDSTTVDLVQSGAGTDIVVTTPLLTPWTPEDSEDPLVLRELGLRIEGNDKMYWYINGVCVGATEVGAAETGGTVEAFTHGMTPTVCLVNGDAGDEAAVAWIDYHTFQTTRVLAPTGDGDL